MSASEEMVVLASCAFVPATILHRLRTTAMAKERILVAAEGDLSADGAIMPVWLLVGPQHVVGVPADGERPLSGPFAYAEVQEFDLWGTVGSTCLRAMVRGAPTILVRFTNEFRERFSRVVQQLKQLCKGQPLGRDALLAPDGGVCPRCRIILDPPNSPCPRCIQHKALLGRLVTMLKPYAPSVALLLVLMLLGISLDLLPPYLTKILVDKVLTGESPELLGMIIFSLATAYFGRTIINFVLSRVSSRVGTRMTRNMRLELFRKLEEMSVDYYDRTQVGSLMTRLMGDAEVLQGFVIQATQGLFVNILLVIGIGVIMFCMNARLALFVMIPIPFMIAGTMIFRKHIRPSYYRYSDSVSKLGGMLNSVLSGIRLVKAFGQEEREHERFTGRVNYLATSRYEVDTRAGGFQAAMAYVFMLPGLMIWYVGGREVLADSGVSLGVLMAFLGYLGMFYGPLQSLAVFSNWVTQFLTSTQRVFEILDTPTELLDKKDAKPMPKVGGAIEFENVTFGYDPYNAVIKDVSMQIRAGENIGIVGRSGSGKTTLVNLLCRFYDPQKGTVRVDGVDVRDVRRVDLRRHIGLVLQESFLFRASIAENIAYGRPDSTMQEIITASRAANCHDFIMRMPQGYDTQLGERGAGLSGGERQRVSIARALLCDPSILILDEATSSVDTEAEQEIQKALEVLCEGRTTIAIAHRLSTLRNADRIYVVEHGRIAECGAHAELMVKQGIYYRLVKIQTELATVDIT